MSNSSRSASPNTEHLTVVGEAKLRFVPTVAEISVSITRTEELASAAKANVDARCSSVIAIARETGLSTNEITGSDLSIAPRREYRNREHLHVGFAAERQIELKLRDLKRFNELVGRLVDVPVDRIVRIETKLEDESEANRAALAAAIEDAKAKAQTIAEQFNVQLGGVFSVISLPKEERFHIGGAASRASEEDPTFEPGTIEIEGRIEVTFYLAKPGSH